MIRRRLLHVAALCVAVPLALAAQRGAGRATVVQVQLLAFNDFHGHLEPPTGSNGRIRQTPAGGATFLATHLTRAIEQQPNSIVVAAGDLIGASPLISGLFHDEPSIEALSAMKLSVTSVGNHEFDKGRRELLRLQNGGCHPTDGCRGGADFKGAQFQYLAANVVDTETGRPLFPATAVTTVDGVRIGFIGETLKGTARIVTPTGVSGLTFLDEASTANQYARELREQGVRAIVLLIHEGGGQGLVDDDADPNGCANFTGPIAAIARKLTADIRVVVSGHSHRFYNCTIAGHLVTSAASFGRMITRINVRIDRSTGGMTSASAVNEIVTRDVPGNPAVTAIVTRYGDLSAPLANRAAGAVTSALTRRRNAAGESILGQVIADAQLASTRAPTTGGSVVAFMNTGGLRADIVGNESADAGPRPVTYGELHTVQPFGNVLTVLTLTGDMIKRLLEQQFSASGSTPDVLQVSDGFAYRYRLNARRGAHVDSDSIAINGRKIGPRDVVRVTAVDFLVAGGGGFTVFAEGTSQIGGEVDVDALEAYFKTHSPVSPGAKNRIVRTD